MCIEIAGNTMSSVNEFDIYSTRAGSKTKLGDRQIPMALNEGFPLLIVTHACFMFDLGGMEWIT